MSLTIVVTLLAGFMAADAKRLAKKFSPILILTVLLILALCALLARPAQA